MTYKGKTRHEEACVAHSSVDLRNQSSHKLQKPSADISFSSWPFVLIFPITCAHNLSNDWGVESTFESNNLPFDAERVDSLPILYKLFRPN